MSCRPLSPGKAEAARASGAATRLNNPYVEFGSTLPSSVSDTFLMRMSVRCTSFTTASSTPSSPSGANRSTVPSAATSRRYTVSFDTRPSGTTVSLR